MGDGDVCRTVTGWTVERVNSWRLLLKKCVLLSGVWFWVCVMGVCTCLLSVCVLIDVSKSFGEMKVFRCVLVCVFS